MSFPHSLHLPPFLRVPLFTFVLAVSTSQSVPHHFPSSSPVAYTDLICHTQDIADCYPAVFSPTKDFQVVHDDQSIPPGLHVRMNLATGRKEARLNIPEPGDNEDTGVVLIDGGGEAVKEDLRPDPSPPENRFLVQGGETKLGQSTFDVDDTSMNVGSGGDVHAIMSRVSLALLRKEWSAFQEEMIELADLAYDVEFGATITANSQLMNQLMSLIHSGDDYAQRSSIVAAITLLGVALHNNPGALESLLFSVSHATQSPAVMATSRLKNLLASAAPKAGRDFHEATRLVFLVHQLCLDSSELDNFLDHDGLVLVNEWLDERPGEDGEPDKTRLKVKIANFIADSTPAIFAAVSKDKRNSMQLAKFCSKFELDDRVRYNTESAEYTSSQGALGALQEVLGENCSG